MLSSLFLSDYICLMIFLLLLTLFLSAMFSGLEIAFVSSSKLKVELRKKHGGLRSKLLTRFYDQPAQLLTSLLVGNNIALVLFTLILSALLTPILEGIILNELALMIIITLTGTIIVLIFGEYVPKVLFRQFGERILYTLAVPVNFIMLLLAIPSLLFTWLSRIIVRLISKNYADIQDNTFSRLELESLVRDNQTLSESKVDANLFGKALYLQEVKVRDCMVPRTEIEYIDVTDSIEDLRALFVSSKLSRIIVIDGDIDNVLGYVHHQQLLNTKGSIRKLIFQIPFVPEIMKVNDLLNFFIKNKSSLACVVDEYGGTSGIITMEDILEQIFGEIEDEHDEEEHVEVQVNEDEFLFSGRLEIDYLNEKYAGLSLPKGEYHTLSGYIIMTTGDIPEEGESVVLEQYKFVFEKVSDKKIELIRLTRLQPGDEDLVA